MVQNGQVYPVRVGLPDFWDALDRGDRIILTSSTDTGAYFWDKRLFNLYNQGVDVTFALLNTDGLSVENLETLSRVRDEILAFKGFPMNYSLGLGYTQIIGLTGPFKVESLVRDFTLQLYMVANGVVTYEDNYRQLLQPSGIGLGFHMGIGDVAENHIDTLVNVNPLRRVSNVVSARNALATLARDHPPQDTTPGDLYIAIDPGHRDSDTVVQLGPHRPLVPDLPVYSRHGTLKVARIEYFGPQGVAGLSNLQPQSVTGISFPTRLEIEGTLTQIDLEELEIAYVELESHIYRIQSAKKLGPANYNLILSRYLGA